MENNYPISDWSEAGRIGYIEKNKFLVELIISQACDSFGEEALSNYFRNQDKTVDWIINQFKSSQFNYEKLPKGIPNNINIFSQLNFWIKYKTGKNIINKSSSVEFKDEYVENPIQQASVDDDIEILAKYLHQLTALTAPDIINYWLSANKKLLDELSYNNVSTTEIPTSNSQKTRYKADASFRYLCLFLGIGRQLDSFSEYERKYLVKGDNIPQYVAGGSETHQSKHKVRLAIKKIIQKFCDIHFQSDERFYLTRSLLKGVAKNATLDVYEINKNDSERIKYEKLLQSFKSKPSCGDIL